MSGVHESHCCSGHGCKYGDEGCPVVYGKAIQLYPCEQCSDTYIPAKRILLGPFEYPKDRPVQRGSSEDDRIKKGTIYLAKIHGRWYMGEFSKQWYGWNFNDWGVSGIQLDSIEDLYEIDLSSITLNNNG